MGLTLVVQRQANIVKKALLLTALAFSYFPLSAQEETPDSTRILEEVIVRAFEQNTRLSSTGIIINVIEQNNANRDTKVSLVSGFNTVPGVRMEERSPGSYRINIRGSSLRSPFGVRNVKVYWNDIPVTDPGGNTYFNQFAYNNFSHIEIFKGPAGSMYGAGTGGLILVNNLERWRPGISLEYIAGSFQLHNVLVAARFGKNNNKNQLTFAHNQGRGYREHSSMRRDNISWISQLSLSGKQQLNASLLFTDMSYETPGALTLNEYQSNPRAARPAAGVFPSAVDARAAIYQKNMIAGFTNSYAFSPAFDNKTSLYGAFSEVKNPAIRNYERRNEPHFGGRTVFTWNNKKDDHQLQLLAGSEFQKGYFNTQVSKNKDGNPDTLLTNDDVNYTNLNFFFQADAHLPGKWLINSGVSLNKTSVRFTRLSNYPVTEQQRTYRNEFAPRLSLRKNLSNDVHIKATASRGFSPPTVAELLPSTGVISTSLEAEYGWNYELAGGFKLFRKLVVDLTCFYFQLNNALVQRRDSSGADYFINAGTVKQSGVESDISYSKSFPQSSRLDYLVIGTAITFNRFRYGELARLNQDFSGKRLPSVPDRSLSILFDLHSKIGFYTNATYYTVSRIFLNDANTVSAQAYHLLGWRLGWKKMFHSSYILNLYAGADNLFNQLYSLGHDINATGGRYYNAAPPRNFYGGIIISVKRKQKAVINRGE